MFWNVDKTERSLYEQNQDRQIKYKHAVDTTVDPMPIGKIPIVRSFVHIYCLSGPNRACHGVDVVKKKKFLICGAWKWPQYQTE